MVYSYQPFREIKGDLDEYKQHDYSASYPVDEKRFMKIVPKSGRVGGDTETV